VQVGALEHLAALAVDDLRCRFSTSSYFRTSLRISKFCCSTWVWADLMARVTTLDSTGTSGGMFSRSMIAPTRAELNIRIRSSSSDR
jgi:hypothetical protein